MSSFRIINNINIKKELWEKNKHNFSEHSYNSTCSMCFRTPDDSITVDVKERIYSSSVWTNCEICKDCFMNEYLWEENDNLFITFYEPLVRKTMENLYQKKFEDWEWTQLYLQIKGEKYE